MDGKWMYSIPNLSPRNLFNTSCTSSISPCLESSLVLSFPYKVFWIVIQRLSCTDCLLHGISKFPCITLTVFLMSYPAAFNSSATWVKYNQRELFWACVLLADFTAFSILAKE